MKFYLQTLGCQQNYAESQSIIQLLVKSGFEKTADAKSADFLMLNACSVRQKPVDRIYGIIKNWEKLQNPSQRLIVSGTKNSKIKTAITGCILPSDLKKLKDRFDLVFGIGDLKTLEKFIKKNFKIKPKKPTKLPEPAFVPIMQGCNNFCSYCVVPYTRGREKSYPKSQIKKEVKRLVALGKKEIMLLGQNVNSYSGGFVPLLKEIIKIPGDFKITFLSPHPKDTSKELIALMAKSKKIKKELHLPLQSGNDRILKLMNRKYTTSEYKKLVGMIRSYMPDIRLSTDIIVGFPTETKKEFKDTYSFCKKLKFNKAFVSQYSPRTGTYSAKNLKDDVTPAEKKRRWEKLDQLINY